MNRETSIGKGLVMVNTGPGKGKTTAAVGAAMRAAGRGLNVLFLQFIKHRDSGELISLRSVPGITVRQVGLGMVRGREVTDEDRKQALSAWRECMEAARNGYGMIVLDEVCPAMKHGLLDTGEVLDFIRTRPDYLHLILTGRYCPDDIIQAADTVTVMEAVRHHYAAGIKSREGIEY